MNLNYYLRGANNLLRYLIYEFPRGIEFSLRDRAGANSENNGYSCIIFYSYLENNASTVRAKR